MLGGQTAKHRERVFTTHANDNRFNVYPARAVRDERWKYIRNLHPEFAFTTHIDLVAGRMGQRNFFSSWETAAQTDPQAAAILKRAAAPVRTPQAECRTHSVIGDVATTTLARRAVSSATPS